MRPGKGPTGVSNITSLRFGIDGIQVSQLSGSRKLEIRSTTRELA